MRRPVVSPLSHTSRAGCLSFDVEDKARKKHLVRAGNAECCDRVGLPVPARWDAAGQASLREQRPKGQPEWPQGV